MGLTIEVESKKISFMEEVFLKKNKDISTMENGRIMYQMDLEAKSLEKVKPIKEILKME